MIKYISFILLLVQVTLNGQTDFFEIIFDSEAKQETFDGIDKIEEKVYTMQLNLEYSVDTFLMNENGRQNYTLQEHNYLTVGPDHQVIIDGYNNEGNLVFKTFHKYDDDDRMVKDQTDYKEGYMSPMSYNKDYHFDENGKLLKVVNAVCDTCSHQDAMIIVYDESGKVAEVNISKPQVGAVKYIREYVADTAVYWAKYDLTEKYINELKRYGNSKEDIPEELVKVFKNENGLTVYKGIRRNVKTQESELKWVKVRDNNNLLVELEHFKNGKIVVHRKFEYDDYNNVTAYTDALSNKTYFNKINRFNKYELKDLGSKTIKYTYDENGEWILKQVMPKGAVYIEKFNERKITYLD